MAKKVRHARVILFLLMLHSSDAGWIVPAPAAAGFSGEPDGARKEPAAEKASEAAQQLLQTAGIQGGLVVHLGAGRGGLAASLGSRGDFLVRGLSRKEEDVHEARKFIKSKGLYGNVSIVHWEGGRLPFVDNLVNLLVVEKPGCVAQKEMMRVLAPCGAAVIREKGTWKKRIKKRPDEIDEWQQYLHGADNNAVAEDTVVGPPRHLQWKTGPAWSRSHMGIPTVVSMVSAGGRLFTIEDRASIENPFLPCRWGLVARDAFNGIVLWKLKFCNWEPVTRYVKDIAVQLQRRLAAVDGSVYCTPGLDAPVTRLDAATGKVLTVYKGTGRTQEFAFYEGVLYIVTGDRMNAARYNIEKPEPWRGMSLGGSDPEAPFEGAGWRGAYAPETPDKAVTVCSIAAVEAASGSVLWKKEGIQNYTGCTLAINGRYAVYQTHGSLTCMNRKTGGMLWKVEKEIAGEDGTSPNTVILSERMVYAQEGKKFCAYSLSDGAKRWQAPIAGNYEKAADLFLAAGSVWTGGSKRPAAYDPLTGGKRLTIRQRMTGPMSHDRCYRNFITCRYFINSKTGGADFLSLDGKSEFPHHWTRGTCGMGVLPCNGLLYAGPYSCQCSMGVMAAGFNAYSSVEPLASSNQEIPVPEKRRLLKGPAYRKVQAGGLQSGAEDWPAYRYDGTRGGVTVSRVSAALTTVWEVRFSSAAAPPVIANGMVFLSQVDDHTVCALSASDGGLLWEYVAGARVDSPPVYYRGVVLFGSRDGWVHCVEASSGTLVWRFKDLPGRMICAGGQLESAWPVCGAILVKDGRAYFAAGRVSFLDGGVVLYAVDPMTGALLHRRRIYGPFQKKSGFPATRNRGFKTDIPVTDGRLIYFRHKAFHPDLSDADAARPHVIATAGFTGSTPQHRTYWTVATGYYGGSGISLPQWSAPWGDILVTDGVKFYELRGFPVKRHSYFDPRVKGYVLFAGRLTGKLPRRRGKPVDRKKAGIWHTRVPMTGEAMTLAGDTLFVAGRPAYFPPDHPVEKYEKSHAGELGGVLWAASAADGAKLAEYTLDAPPVWDGMAAAGGRLYIATTDGRVICMAERRK